MQPLISIIIPVYQTEEYLCECVDSVLAQTLQDIEIILIDDGCTDRCPEICDQYAAEDKRVRVIHQNNQGPSSSRNTGLDLAQGRYIAFMDSDDWISENMLQILYEKAVEQNADITMCGICRIHMNLTEEKLPNAASDLLLDRNSAVRMLVEGRIVRNYVWNKLYRASLWQNVRFPAGCLYEDVSTAYKIFIQADRILIIPEYLYFYRVRPGSIVTISLIRNRIDYADANMQRYEDLIRLFPECREDMLISIASALICIWGLAWKNRKEIRQRYAGTMQKYSDFARENNLVSLSDYFGPSGRMILRLIPHCCTSAYFCADAIYSFYLRWHPIPGIEKDTGF